MIKRKYFLTAETVNIYAWYMEFMKSDRVNALPVKIRYALKKALMKIEPDAKAWIEFNEAEGKNFREKWFDEEHSDVTEIPRVDEAGNPVVNEDGVQETDEGRKIKDEYMEEFQAAQKELQNKLNELLLERNIYEIGTVDFDEFIENLADDSVIKWEDIEMMSIIDGTTNVVKEG